MADFPCGHARIAANQSKRGECLTCKREYALRKRIEAGQQPRDPEWFPCGHPRTDARPGRNDCGTCHREREAARYAADPESARASSSAYAKAHRAERRAYWRAWYARNIEHARAYARARQRLRGLGVRDDPETAAWVTLVLAGPCTYCPEPATTVDHVNPVAAGGTSHWSNLVGACESCNSSKHAATLLAFLLRRQRRTPRHADACLTAIVEQAA